MSERCTESVALQGGWRFRECGKPAKFDPDAAGAMTRCGVHSSARRKVFADRRAAKLKVEFAERVKSRNYEQDIAAARLEGVRLGLAAAAAFTDKEGHKPDSQGYAGDPRMTTFRVHAARIRSIDAEAIAAKEEK